MNMLHHSGYTRSKQGTLLAAPICANHINIGMQTNNRIELGIRFGNMIISPLLNQDDVSLVSISNEKMKERLDIAEDFQNKIC